MIACKPVIVTHRMVWLELEPDSCSEDRSRLAELAHHLVNKDGMVNTALSTSLGPWLFTTLQIREEHCSIVNTPLQSRLGI